jgi:hypothetical protein
MAKAFTPKEIEMAGIEFWKQQRAIWRAAQLKEFRWRASIFKALGVWVYEINDTWRAQHFELIMAGHGDSRLDALAKATKELRRIYGAIK